LGQIYKLVFYPERGKRLSPYDYLIKLDPGDQARVYRHIESMRDLYPQYWQKNNIDIKLIEDDLYQLTSDSIRSYICIDKYTLVVVYMCRKQSQKAKPKDIKRARNSMLRYFQEG